MASETRQHSGQPAVTASSRHEGVVLFLVSMPALARSLAHRHCAEFPSSVDSSWVIVVPRLRPDAYSFAVVSDLGNLLGYPLSSPRRKNRHSAADRLCKRKCLDKR